MESKGFKRELYDNEADKDIYEEALNRVGAVIKNFQTDVVLYKQDREQLLDESKKLTEVKKAEIRVNEPLKFDDFALYQVDYRLNELKTMIFSLLDKKTESNKGEITIDLLDPKDEYKLGNGYKVELLGYYPDFSGLGKNGEPQTKSPIPTNPAFLFKMFSPEHPDGEVSFTAIRKTVEPLGETDYKMKFSDISTQNVTVLTVRKDLTLWTIGIGGFIFMLGLIQGSYWNHRRIWLHRLNDEILIAGHTNKNWYGLKKEIAYILNNTSIPQPVDQLEKKSTNKRGEN